MGGPQADPAAQAAKAATRNLSPEKPGRPFIEKPIEPEPVPKSALAKAVEILVKMAAHDVNKFLDGMVVVDSTVMQQQIKEMQPPPKKSLRG